MDDRYYIFFFAGRKRVNLVVIFNKGREETFAVSLQNGKTCVCIKYLTLVRQRKLIAINFTFLYSFFSSEAIILGGSCPGAIIQG